MEDVEGLVDRTEQRRRRVSAQLDTRNRDRLGQFFTPALALAARLIAGMPRLPRHGCLRVLDPGAGVGSLTTALTARVIRESPALALDVVAVDVDPTIARELGETLSDCTRVSSAHGVQAMRKPQAIVRHARTEKLLLPNERFVLVKRFSSKEERRRTVAAVYQPRDDLPSEVGFENHLNVFHRGGRGLPPDLAAGLCLWLNSTIVDRHFRTFSGHTQVNATDLRTMRYPSTSQLSSLGSSLGHGHWPSQEKIDSLVATHVLDTLNHALGS